jgi:HEAT repeat protein
MNTKFTIVKHALTLLAALLLMPLAALLPASAAETVVLEQSHFGTVTHPLPPNNYGLGVDSTSSPIAPLGDKWHFTTKPQLKVDAHGLPALYSLRSSKGRLMVVPEAGSFRMTFTAANSNKPHIDFRWRGEHRRYQLDLAAGMLTKFDGGKKTLLAQAKMPLFAEDGAAESWSAFEVTVQNYKIQVRVALDGETWIPAIECEDSAPIPSGAILLSAGEADQGRFVSFGDVRVVAETESFTSRALAATGPEFHEALITSMDRLARDPGATHALSRRDALEHLRHLAAPVPPEVVTALAVAQSDQDISIRLAALRTIHTLQLKLDVPALLLDGLSSDNAAIRVGSVRGIINLKLTPQQIQTKMVDGLMNERRFARIDVKRLITALGDPLRAALPAEVQARYAAATDAGVKASLLRALGRDSGDDKPIPAALPLLAQALSDPSAEVRLAAAKTLRWLESPLAWVKTVKAPPNVFRDHPGPTAQIVKALQIMLQGDASVACRAEAVGCLAEMRQVPETIIAALADKQAAVRIAATQGLCCFDRAQLQTAIPALQKLALDAECRTDAVATLGYIQDEAVQAIIAGKKVSPMGKLSPQDVLKETALRAENAARLSIALHAERIPFPDDLLAHFSAQLALKRNRVAANARLQQELQFHSFDDKAGLDGTKLPLVYALHHSKSRHFPGGLTAETETLFKESMFSMVDWSSKAYFNDFVQDVMKLPGTENQSLQYRYGLWFLDLGLLNEDPAYARRMLRGGKTVAQCYAEWNAFMKEWLRTHALNGFWIELGSGYSGRYSLPAIFAFYVAATDPETRQLAKMFIDLALVEEAQAGYGEVRGGSKNRIKDQGIYGTFGGITSLLYEGRTVEGKGCHQLAVSGYQAPAVAVLLRNFEQYPPQPIIIANRRLGEVRAERADAADEAEPAAAAGNDDDAPVPTNQGHAADSNAVNYIWKSRHYMLGSMLRHPKTVMSILYNQRPWNGIVFANGKGLFPACPWSTPYFSYQHENVLILQRDRTDKEAMSVFISPELEKTEENGWVFINAGDAYAGIKILTGGHTWAKGKFLCLVPNVQTSPILIQGGDKNAFGSFANFKAAVQTNTLTFSDNKVEYSGPKQPRIEFFTESTGQAPEVNGKPFRPDATLVYSSPYMQRKAGESIVTVTVGGKRVVYDFDKATITESVNHPLPTQP